MTEVALFYKIDAEPGFGLTICRDDEIDGAVREALFGKGDITAENATEIRETAAELLTSGRVDFEDGWLDLRNGMADAIAFVVERLNEARDDERFSDQRRADEQVRANASVIRYGQLRQALIEALGDKAAVVLAVAN